MNRLPGAGDFHSNGDTNEIVFGFDLGVASTGWAVFKPTVPGRPEIVAAGSRVFDAGVEGSEDDIQKGKDTSRAAKRRDKRLLRRQTTRRRRRIERIARLLARHGLLPTEAGQQVLRKDTNEAHPRDVAIKALDKELLKRYDGHTSHHLLPYLLRRDALKRKLEPYELGRAIFHLAQRRGFLSNRKATAKADEDLGQVKAGIKDLKADIQNAGVETLGAYFASLDPEQKKIRGRYTQRQMFIDEFDLIWQRQLEFGAKLKLPNDKLRKQIRRALFFQRPLRSVAGLIGRCEIDATRRRAPAAGPLFQYYRCLQTVNNLRLIDPDGQAIPLTPEQRSAVLQHLRTEGDLTPPAALKLIDPKLKRPRNVKGTSQPGWTLNIERDAEDGKRAKIIGDRTAAKLRPIFGVDRWDTMSDETKLTYISCIQSIALPDALEKLAHERWDLASAQAKILSKTRLEDGRARYCNRVLKRFIEVLEQPPFPDVETARRKLFPQEPHKALDKLPPVDKAMGTIANPAVRRSLTELRKVANELLQRFGKPDRIHIELARDLRNSRKNRERIYKDQANREKRWQHVEKQISQHCPWVTQITRDSKQRWMLAEECHWICPYTGHPITPDTLLGNHSQFDVEHIIPRHRSLDNSFTNLTLCYHEENRTRKHKQTPWEAYHATPEKYAQIIERVRRFKTPPDAESKPDWASDARDLARDDSAAAKKLRLFKMTRDEAVDYFADFTARHLTDTRYVSRLASEYLGLLFDHAGDGTGKRRIIQPAGRITSLLRNVWDLNELLGQNDEKNRSDHRHHALDAAVIAATTPKTINMLSAVAAGIPVGRRRFEVAKLPWPEFKDQLRSCLDRSIVSHRTDHRLAGALHKDTLYGKARDGEKRRPVRKELRKLTINDLENIIGDDARKAVNDRFKALTANAPKSKRKPDMLFADSANHPVGPNGRPIHKVRVWAKVTNPLTVGKGYRTRYAQVDENHHAVIFSASTSRNGKEKWHMQICDKLTAHHRLYEKQSVVQFTLPSQPGAIPVMTLHKNDTIELDSLEDGENNRQLYVVQSFSTTGGFDFIVRLHYDGRPKTEIVKAGELKRYRFKSASALQSKRPRKVTITPTGLVRTEELPGHGRQRKSTGHRGTGGKASSD